MEVPPRSRKSSSGGFRPNPVRRLHPLFALCVVIVGFVVIIGGSFYTLTAQPVTVMIDGRQQDVRTHQSTVAGLLTELQFPVQPQDIVSPATDTPIRNGLIVTIIRAHTVLIEADGQRRQVLTQAIDPRAILAEAGIVPGPHDLIRVDNADVKAEPYTSAPKHILLIRALAVQLDDNGTNSTLYTAHRTVGEALHDAGTVLYLGDAISPDPDSPLADNTAITIRRAVPVTIVVDGRTLETRTHGATVSAALAEAGISLVGLDIANLDGNTPVQSGLTIRIVRITEEELIGERTQIDFKKVERSDPTLPLDTRQIIQQGIPGIVEQRTRIRREDGVEVSRSAVEDVVIQSARDEITAVGTLATLKSLDTPNGPIQYWRTLKMRAVSYKPSSTGRSADDPQYGLTATGQKLHKGLVAVDPNVIPLGTQLFIPGYGLATAADIGGGVQGTIIDLGYGDDDYQEWHTTVDVYLLPPIPPQDQIPIIPQEAR